MVAAMAASGSPSGYIRTSNPNCLTPDVLAQWIEEKGEDFGSVYLVPAASAFNGTASELMTSSLTSGVGSAAAVICSSYR